MHYRFHNRPQLTAILCQMNPFQTLSSCYLNIHYVSLWRLALASGILPSGFPSLTLYSFRSSLCMQLVPQISSHLDLITLIMRQSLFWDVTHFRVVVSCGRFGATYRSHLNTFTAVVDLSRFNNSCLKSPASTLVDLTFQSRALRSALSA